MSQVIFRQKKLPEDVLACHKCDNPGCFRPIHLFPGSFLDNNTDRVLKNRSRYRPPCGEESGKAKLTNEKVIEMRELSASGISYAEIGRRYGVSAQSASSVCRGLNWAHIRTGLDVLEAKPTIPLAGL